jgi:hypothetical protein
MLQYFHFPCSKQFEYKFTEIDLQSLCGYYYDILAFVRENHTKENICEDTNVYSH